MLEGLWQEGFMAIAAIGATNIGSIEVILNSITWKPDQEEKKLVWEAENKYIMSTAVLFSIGFGPVNYRCKKICF